MEETNNTSNNYNKNVALENRELSRVQLLILYFLFFSFIGWLLETFYSVYELGHFTNRGFLYGPICPIYGYGALILILFFTKYKNKSIRLFIYSAVVFSMFEYAVGYCMDALFSMKWWDYSNEFFNLNGRISILYSFVWGIIAILFVNHIYPFFSKKFYKVLSKIPYKVQIYSLYFLIMCFAIDNVFSFVRYLT